MVKNFEDITVINDRKLFDKIAEYEENLIQEATSNGALSEQNADNEYTREIGRVGIMLADYESTYMKFKNLKFKSPLVIGIEKELSKRSLKQREAAELLHVKESTFSQVIRGKRPVSMKVAKRLYKVFNIDPKLLLEYS
ncbi:MAG: helix-turn-helix transcriptional regulator [Dysgonamonadaceae bacterium]|jgi:predicted XRE-type DNA-binding protein|nr:helix-turn-helix transcriptional regulator [Dysgonamonadaceae bacterium]